MATALYQASTQLLRERFIARWFFAGMAILMLATSVAGFAPAILYPAGRHGPLSLLVVVHGLVFFAWLLLYLAQSLLVATGRAAFHRRLGFAAALVLALMIPLGYSVTVTMVRRGFDLSGDQKIVPNPPAGSMDPLGASVFNFGYLLTFTVLAAAAICFRRRPAVHKRLMLFANIELMGAPIAHIMGHQNILTPATIMIPFSLFLLAAVARDYLAEKRIHPLTIWLAIILFVSQPIEGILIAPSAAWYQIAVWLTR
ncbi:MAG TPA: hypothetical protein VIN93_07655 [Bryobacteraceae bacterium]